MFIYDLSFFLTSTAFVDTNAKYGIPLLRYTVFLKKMSFRVMHKCARVFCAFTRRVALRGFCGWRG